jgi:hypothetical protein
MSLPIARLVALVVAPLAIGSVLFAQSQSMPATQPATQPTSQPSSDVFDRLLGPDPVRDAPPLKPAQPAMPDKPTLPAPNVLPAGPLAGGGGAQQQAVAREGTYIVDRVGRLTRAGDGALEFTLEADGKALQDPPLRLLPNLKLSDMEDAIASNSRDLRFRVTGMLTEYRGRNFVLIEKFVVLSEERKAF